MRHERQPRQSVSTVQAMQVMPSTYGIITSYNPTYNTATVITAKPGSSEFGETLFDVPCPVHLGVQAVAPEVGRPCWVSFKDNSMAEPMITHFFNHVYNEIDYLRQTKAINPIPRYILNL